MNEVSRYRMRVLAIIGLSMFAALTARLWYLQVMVSEQAVATARSNITRVISVPAPRGRILDINGRAGVVLPDNVLFEGGAGETLRKRLLKEFAVHTLVRLPTGIFYAGGVKANVLFFDKHPASDTPWTEKLWVYDFRTNQHFTMKQNPLRRQHLDEFVECYKPGRPRGERVESERFKAFTYEELMARDKANLDLVWLKDDSIEDVADLPAPEVLAREIMEQLEVATGEFAAIAEALDSQ